MMTTAPDTIQKYIDQQPEEIQPLLEKVYATIRKAAPDAVEGIGYGIPEFKLNGKPLVYFAGAKKHIGFYATPNGHEAFKKEFSKYKQGKGSVQFPLNEPIPLSLISKVVRFRIKAVKQKMAMPQKGRSA